MSKIMGSILGWWFFDCLLSSFRCLYSLYFYRGKLCHCFSFLLQAGSTNQSQPELPDWFWGNTALLCHHCNCSASQVRRVCRCTVQLASVVDWLWLLSLLRNHPRQDVASLLHLQQSYCSEKKGIISRIVLSLYRPLSRLINTLSIT